MDDPWGSPWTSNNDDFGSFASAPPGPASASGSLSPGPKPPRPALLAKISNQDLASNSNPNSNPKPPTLSFSSLEPSPWADDDNFGDWAAADSGSLGWGASSFGISGNDDTNKLSPRPNRSPQRSPQLSPVPWATAMTPIARPPGALTPRSRASSTMSRASDPWGRGVDVSVDVIGDNGDKMDDNTSVVDIIANKVDDVHTADKVDTEEDYDTEGESRTESHVDTDHDHRDDHPTEDHDARQQVSPTTSVEEEGSESESNEENEDDDEENENDTENDLQLENSQDKSDGPNYPALRRKPSSKVQGLVELFDGLAKRPISASGSLSGSKSGSRSASATRSVSATRSASATRSMERRPSRQLSIKDLPEDGVDEEDTVETIEPVLETAEEVEALPEPEASPVEAPQIIVEPTEPTKAIEEPSEAQPTSKDVAPAQPESKEVKDSKDSKDSKDPKDTNTTPITPADALLALYGKQDPYVVDTAKVDALFPILPKPRTAEENDKDDVNAFIPDGYILDDSFTNISERRTWYRIARHGSSRKHNAGGSEDDNYRPVTWATSTVLPETVKIVRRWMEEDSFTGKPTLGAGLYSGGARGTNMFGWDSAAEPVTLDQVFKRAASPAPSVDAKKETKGHAHSRTLSNTQSAFGWGSEALPAASGFKKEKESVRHSVHFGGFPSLSSFGEGENVWAPEGDKAGKAKADKPVSPLRQSFDVQTQGQTNDHKRGHKSTPSIGSLPPPPKLVPRPSPLSINTVVAKPEAVDSEDDKNDEDDDDEWGEMVMSPTAGESSLPMPVPAAVSLQQVPILPPPEEPLEPLEPEASPASFSTPFTAPAPPKAVSFQEPFQAPFDSFQEPFSEPFSEKVSFDNTSFIDSIISSLPDLSYMAV